MINGLLLLVVQPGSGEEETEEKRCAASLVPSRVLLSRVTPSAGGRRRARARRNGLQFVIKKLRDRWFEKLTRGEEADAPHE